MRQSPPPPVLADVMAGDGISWLRLVTAVVLLALSLAIGHRTAQDAPRSKAVPQPVRDAVVAGVDLPPLGPAAVESPVPFADRPAPARPKATRHGVSLRPGEHRAGRAARRSSGSTIVRVRRHDVAFVASGPAAFRRGLRTRAQVRGEYLRSREVVAALNGEDSGSAYLMRAAARHGPRRR